MSGEQSHLPKEEMAPETLEALRGSIAKWEGILAGTHEDLGHNNCPLCKLFFADHCRGCPVRDRTGRESCGGTPYRDWEEVVGAHAGWDKDSKWVVFDDESRKLAEQELAFLRSLLPGRKAVADDYVTGCAVFYVDGTAKVKALHRGSREDCERMQELTPAVVVSDAEAKQARTFVWPAQKWDEFVARSQAGSSDG